MREPDNYPVESHLAPITAHTFSRDGEWWRGIVHSEDQYGNEHLRLYLWRNNDQKGWQTKHKWNVQPERWEQEKAVVEEYVGAPEDHTSPHFPVQYYNVVGGKTIEKNDDWWTAVVQYEDDWSDSHDTRLYMWKFKNGEPTGTGFKWNIERDTWQEERRVAEGLLEDLE